MSFWLNRRANINYNDTVNNKQDNHNRQSKIIIPWFALMFILVAGFNSLNLLPDYMVNALLKFDNILLAMAMVALGLTTHISAIKKAGVKPMLVGGMMMVWLVVMGGVLQILL